MPDTTSGLWNAGDVYRRIALGSWVSATPEKVVLSATPSPSATVSTYSGYIVFKFTSSGTLNVGSGEPGTSDVLVVGGGQTAGSTSLSPGPIVRSGAGGNSGGVLVTPAHTIVSGSPISVTVGGGGSVSSFGPLNSGSGSATSGATRREITPATPYPASAIAGVPGTAGPTNDYLTGTPTNYGGGGASGGAALNFPHPAWPIQPVPGGAGGGGSGGGVSTLDGNRFDGSPGGAGGVNTGGGGGGAGASNPLGTGPIAGANGGSGVVIVRFPDTQFAI